MTKTEFLARYTNYTTPSGDEARAEADKANAEGIDQDRAVAVNFGPFGWGVMLASVDEAAAAYGVIGTQRETP